MLRRCNRAYARRIRAMRPRYCSPSLPKPKTGPAPNDCTGRGAVLFTLHAGVHYRCPRRRAACRSGRNDPVPLTKRNAMTRERFAQELNQLRDQIITMGSYVAEELRYALAALTELDLTKAGYVTSLDKQVNQIRFAIEERCFLIIAMQQPAAGDLRLVFAAANMIVDLERMGDQAKGIAKLIPQLKLHPDIQRPSELDDMGKLVAAMLHDALRAYADGDIALSQNVAGRDPEVDSLYANVFTQIMFMLAQSTDPERVRVIYEMLRCARELERFGDLVCNFAERSIYLVTGSMPSDSHTADLPGFKREL